MLTEQPSISTLRQLLDQDARKFTCAEVQLKGCLHEWLSNAGSMQLKLVLQKYLAGIQQHIEKFVLLFDEEEISTPSNCNLVMDAFIEEATRKLALCSDIAIRDVCLLAAIQNINHYKISTYGTAAAFAGELGMEKHAAILHEAEINEKQVDDRLSQLAAHEINRRASIAAVLQQ